MGYRLTLFIGLLLITLPGIGVDLYAPSLPAMTQYFHVHPSLMKMSITVYLFGLALGQFVFGTISDTIGRKFTMLIGAFVFCVSSLLIATVTQSIAWLLIFRAWQGFGTAAGSIIPKAIFTDSLEGDQYQFAMSYLTIAWGVCPIVAPVIGGYLQYYLNWQANFYAYGIYSAVIFFILIFFLKETLKKRISFDLSTLACHYKETISHRIFLGCVFTMGLGYTLIILFNLVGPYLVQNQLHYSAAAYGHIALIVGAAYFVGTSINRLFIKKSRPIVLMRFGISIMLVASIVLLLLAYEVKLNIWIITVPIIFIVIGVGFMFSNAMTKVMMIFPEKAGIAGAVLGVLFVITTAISSTIISYLKHGSLVPPAWAYLVLVALQIFVYYFLLIDNPPLLKRSA